MKKKLPALLCAAMMACALPALAWADEAAGPEEGGAAKTATSEPSATDADEGAPAADEKGWMTGPRLANAENEDGSCEIFGETTAASLAIIATTEAADDNDTALKGMPSYRIVTETATRKMGFLVVLAGAYADCNKLEVHVRPNAGSAGVAKTFEVTKCADVEAFDFTSEVFNIGDQQGNNTYDADIVMTFVPSRVNLDEPAADEPAAEVGSGADTGAKSPKTGLVTGAVAGGSAMMLVGAGCVALALRRKLRA